MSYNQEITTYTDGRYIDRWESACVMELLSHNVGIRQVEPVIAWGSIKTVWSWVWQIATTHSNQWNANWKQIPSTHSISWCLNTVSTQYLALRWNHQVWSQIHRLSSGYTYWGLDIGIHEVTPGSAEVALETLQEILDKLSEASLKSGDSNAGKKIVANIKSTMSDRVQVQKSFNEMLAASRAKILPTIIEDWSDFNEMKQQTMSQMYHFFCGMHIVVNMLQNPWSYLKML